MKARRSYPVFLTINDRDFSEVVIDPHYEEKHYEMSDFLILRIVKELDGRSIPLQTRKENWQFFEVDDLMYSGKQYRLIFCLHDSKAFVGVINCFRR